MNPYFETKLGKLYNCDCLEFMKDIEDKSVDLVLADSPYGIDVGNQTMGKGGGVAVKIDYGSNNWDKKPMQNDQQNECFRISSNQIFFGGNYFKLPPSPCWLVWDKDNGNTDFADCELIWTSFKTSVRKFRWKWSGMLQENMGKHKEIRVHPTQKPVSLLMWIIRKYSKDNDLVLDPFIGSGTTAIACEKLNRQWIGIEISEKYCEISAKRISLEARQGKLW